MIYKQTGDSKHYDYFRYVAKSGAVIDANIVNFSLPKKTAKVEKMMQKKAAKPSTFTKELKKLGHEVPSTSKASTAATLMKGVTFPKSSRRETKIPLKYRMDGDFSSDGRSFSSASNTPAKPAATAATTKTTKQPVKKALEEEEEPVVIDEDETSQQSKLRNDADVMVAVKSRALPAAPLSPIKPVSTSTGTELTSLGVGTFSIDIETAKGIVNTVCEESYFEQIFSNIFILFQACRPDGSPKSQKREGVETALLANLQTVDLALSA